LGEIREKEEKMEEYQDRSLRGRVFRKLREDILSGVYQERDELREITIGEELGVSRTPVREALRQLELEGLVEIIPNKGAYVTGISRKDVADIYKIRSMLEGMCARWATEYITGKQIEELEEVLLLSEFHLRKKSEGQAEQVTELDGKFHKILYAASNSRILEHVLSDFHKYVQMARAMSVGEKNRAEKSIQEHRQILEAIKKRDGELAEKLANRHIMNVMKNLHLVEKEVFYYGED
jgi:DNA-binding GntR family transcriptional regulator